MTTMPTVKVLGDYSPLPAPKVDLHAIRARATERGGFLAEPDVAQLASHPQGRLWTLLVRCGRCRFVCAAQDVAFLSQAVTLAGDYVRDVSFPAQS